MKLIACVALLFVIGCGSQEPVSENVSSSPPTQVQAVQTPPAAPTMRPRFRADLEAFFTEAKVLTNLPSTGASVADMESQRDKLQQTFARMSDPQSDVEKSVHAKAKQFTVDTLALVEMSRLYHESLSLNGRSFKPDLDKMVDKFKTELKPIEETLDQ